MPLVIHGLASDKYFKKQRIEEGRVEPIRLPFEAAVTKEFIDVSPDNAWLPLALALVERLHRLWNLVCGGSYLAERVKDDEYLYQVMRASLDNVLEYRIEVVDTRDIIRERLPSRLPTSGELVRLGHQDVLDSDNDFELMQQSLIGDAVRLDITPDTRTVEDALAQLDIQLSNLALTHLQDVLRRADDLDLDDRALDDLRRSIRAEQRRMRNGIPQYLAMAIEILDRIDTIWACLYPDPKSLQRYPGDELAYQGYLQLLFRSLSSHEYREVSALAQQLLPRLLPARDELVATNPLFSELPARLERLYCEIVALATRLGEPVRIDDANEPDMDTLFEEELWNWESLQKVVAESRSKAVLERDGATTPSERTRRGRGRPASTVTYEIAADVWWKLHALFGDKPPTQKEISEHLESLGFAIKERTLRNKIAEWTANNRKWPPPKDRSEAA
jgi:hypothetical protein